MLKQDENKSKLICVSSAHNDYSSKFHKTAQFREKKCFVSMFIKCIVLILIKAYKTLNDCNKQISTKALQRFLFVFPKFHFWTYTSALALFSFYSNSLSTISQYQLSIPWSKSSVLELRESSYKGAFYFYHF